MPGFLLHQQAQVLCSHAGQATPMLVQPRVKVMGMSVALQGAPWTVAGCTLPPPPAANGPCVTAVHSTAALRVTSFGIAVLLFDSQATCAPTGTPLLPPITQTRVTGM